MASRIQSVALAVGAPILSNMPQVYLRGTSLFATPDTVGFDVDLTVGPGGGQVADLNGFRGAIVTIFHAPSPASQNEATQFRLRHGTTSTYSAHAYVSSDIDWKMVQAGNPNGGVTTTITYLVDASRVDRYISVEATLLSGSTLVHSTVVTPIGPIVARKSNVDRTNDLFVTASGDLTFPSLDPT